METDRFNGIFLAVAFHGLLFAAGSAGLLHKAEYGMDFSNGAAEVDLVAAPAPAELASAVQAPDRHEAPPAPPAMEKEDVAEPTQTQAAPTPVAAPAAPNAILHTTNLNGPLGDGSSPVAGTDATTLRRAGSSGAYFKPGYARNPPPAYPAEARRLKQEGRALLDIAVTAEGAVASVKLKESSGFPLLDEAALRGVQHWKFRPATLAGLRVDTVVEVPIRFQLK